jgi:Ca2+-binding RTX toxin-like protein
MAAPGPSPVVNTQFLSDDGVWNFSDFGEDVDLNDFSASFGAPIRMFAGADFVEGAEFESTGWSNQVNGNIGTDVMEGGSFRDKILGGADNDVVSGLNGADWLNGNQGDDVVSGQAGNDLLRGGKGNDTLTGSVGNDILVGDFGRDQLSGGSGYDRFVLRTDSKTEDGILYRSTSAVPTEVDVILDFTANESVGNVDKIVITGIASFAQLELTDDTIDGFGGTLISFTPVLGGEKIGFVRGITVANLASGDGANFVLGVVADDFLSKLNPDYFLANPNMATDLIPV